eukprot:2059836-Pyramimonas_sp.AAC.1
MPNCQIGANHNAENGTDKQGCGHWPESGLERSQRQNKAVPDQIVVQQFLAKSITRSLSIKACDQDVYATSHSYWLFFRQSAFLILARLEFLKETLYHTGNYICH